MRGRGLCMAGVACVAGGGGVAGGHAWQGGIFGGHAWWGGVHGKGACMAGGFVCGRGHAWQGVGMRGGGVCMARGHAWHARPPADTTTYGDTVNERAVRILLECILVLYNFILNVFVLVFNFNFFFFTANIRLNGVMKVLK